MSLPVVWSTRARRDFGVILAYIRTQSPRGAASIRNLVQSSVERLPAYPLIHREGRVPGTREAVVHPNYLYVYQVRAADIRILRVVHARQTYP